MLSKIGVFSLLACVVSAVADPAVIWKSQPVNPGEAVMVFGGPWTSNSVVELSGKADIKVDPICVTADALTFIYPKDWPLSEFSARISDGSGSVVTSINAPDVWWIQGDRGMKATSGGWLGVFGRSIGYNDQAFVELKGAKNLKISAKKFGLFDMFIDIPSDIATGEYEVFVSNGLKGDAVSAGKLKIVSGEAFWKKEVFNVVDYGATANDRNDDSRAILAALKDIKANGGGILYFPRGRFGMQGTIELPPNSLVKGAGMELSQIYWLDEDNPTGALIAGTYNWGVKDVFLAAGHTLLGIGLKEPSKDDDWKIENIVLENVRMRFLSTDANSKAETFRRTNQHGYAVRIHGDLITMKNCDVYASVGGVSFGGDYIVFQNNILSSATCHHFGGANAIIENNNIKNGGISFAPGSKGVYFKGNDFGYVFNNGDRETFTFDGGRTTYNGTVVSVSKQGMELKSGAWRDSVDSWIGESVLVFGGKGAGQHRFVKKIDGRKVEIDEPWTIMPDSESFFVIGKERSKLLFLDNHCGDGNPFQLYGSSTDVVLSGNKVERNSGIHAYGMTKGGSPEPSWFVQFLDNELLEGNAVRGPWSYMMPAADGYFAFFDRGIKRPLPPYPESRVGIMRRNIIHNNGFLYTGPKVENMLVENNMVKDSDKGIVAKSKGLIVRGNDFEEVLYPYAVSDDAVFSPAEEFAANLQSIKTVLGAVPAGWDDYIKQADDLIAKNIFGNELDAAISALRQKAAVTLSGYVGEKVVEASVVSMLLGVDLEQNSPWQFTRLNPEKNTIVRVGNGVYPESGIPANVSGTTEGFEGWEVKTQKELKLLPGKKFLYQLDIMRPAGKLPMFILPVEYTISGDGWAFKFNENYGYDKFKVNTFLVMGPFKNISGEDLDTQVHPPEIDLDVTKSFETINGETEWAEITADSKGVVDLTKILENTDLTTAHAVAIVRANRPTRVNVKFSPNFYNLAFVNGKRIGSSNRRDALRCVELKKGDNLFHIISSHKSGKWPIEFILTPLDPVLPDDLEVLTGAELMKSPLLTSAGKNIPEGKELPNSLGIDWKLKYHDEFERLRFGDDFISQSISYMPQTAKIVDGEMRTEASRGVLTFDQDISLPVRIDLDMRAADYMAGIFFSKKGLTQRSYWYGPNGCGEGTGYYMSLGWHDAKNNRILKGDETVVLDEKTPMLESGKVYHITGIFAPPLCQIYVDNKLVMEYKDPAFLKDMDRIGIFQFGEMTFDNVRIYEVK